MKPATREELYLVARYEWSRRRAVEDCTKDSSLTPIDRLSYHLERTPTEVPYDFPQVGCDSKMNAA